MSSLTHPNHISQPPADAGSAPGVDDVEDPELLALPAPPRRRRGWTLVLLALVAVTAGAMVYSLHDEAIYALASTSQVDVGDLHALDAARVSGNQCVRAHGSLGGVLAVRFERPFESDTYRVAPVLGRRDVWVETRVPAGEEGARYVPPTSFAGRFVRWDASGLRRRGLAHAVGALTSQSLPADAWLLVDGESPGAARWALGLAVMFAGFALWSAVTTVRLLRRVQ